ncbi:MAG: glycosyltransferase family 9 protein [Verrucomicrobia bacterium]|nr:glycosyltransferase family 9 protein [Verrucomicrobiota bacterium]
MKVAALQKIDRYIGVPLCFGLTVFRKLFGRKTFSPPPLRRILFVKLAEQGSTVLAYSAIRVATEMVGRENVYVACFDDNRFILDALGLIPEENVVPITYSSPAVLTRSAGKALVRLQKLKLDAAIDMEFFARGSAAFTLLTGAKLRVGFHAFFGAGPYRGDLFTHRLLYNPYLHTAQMFQLLVEALRHPREQLPTLPVPPPPLGEELPRFVAAPLEIEVVRELLASETGQGELPPILLLNPNASDLLPLRRWEMQRYVQLARRLLLKYPGAYVGFTGAPNEVEAAEALVKDVGSARCFSLAGKTTLRQLLIAYSLARVLVTNDSGPAHFAALTAIQVVTLFGPETPRLFAAPTPRNTPVWAGIACSPCVNAYNNRQTRCTNNLCMQQITVDQVFEEVCCAYDRSRADGRLGRSAA